MRYNVYRTSNNGNELWLKKEYCGNIVEYFTGVTVGDTLPVILSDEVALIYNALRSMKSGETFQYNEFLVECI